jgi:hypothetical protein
MDNFCKDRCKILEDQNKFSLELCECLLNLIELQQKNNAEGQELVNSCGATSIEYHFRKKIAALNQSEHEKDMKRLEQKIVKIQKVNELGRIDAERNAG